MRTTAFPAIGHVDSRLHEEHVGECGPIAGGTLRPRAVLRHAQAVALHPHEREVAARGAIRDVAFVEHGDLLPRTDQAPCDRRPDYPAADHGDVVLRQVCLHPANGELVSWVGAHYSIFFIGVRGF
jgi:hypothetical protein